MFNLEIRNWKREKKSNWSYVSLCLLKTPLTRAWVFSPAKYIKCVQLDLLISPMWKRGLTVFLSHMEVSNLLGYLKGGGGEKESTEILN